MNLASEVRFEYLMMSRNFGQYRLPWIKLCAIFFRSVTLEHQHKAAEFPNASVLEHARTSLIQLPLSM